MTYGYFKVSTLQLGNVVYQTLKIYTCQYDMFSHTEYIHIVFQVTHADFKKAKEKVMFKKKEGVPEGLYM